MVYITGDIHGEVARVREMVSKYNITSDDIIVLLGDVGMNYYGNKHGDRHRKKKLNSLGINYLLNVGPDALGRIPSLSVEALRNAAELFEKL